MFLMIRDGVPYLTYVSYAAYVLMSRGKRRKIVIVSSLQKSDEPLLTSQAAAGRVGSIRGWHCDRKKCSALSQSTTLT